MIFILEEQLFFGLRVQMKTEVWIDLPHLLSKHYLSHACMHVFILSTSANMDKRSLQMAKWKKTDPSFYVFYLCIFIYYTEKKRESTHFHHLGTLTLVVDLIWGSFQLDGKSIWTEKMFWKESLRIYFDFFFFSVFFRKWPPNGVRSEISEF